MGSIFVTIVLSKPKRSIFSLKIRAREASISFAINTPSPVNRDAISQLLPPGAAHISNTKSSGSIGNASATSIALGSWI